MTPIETRILKANRKIQIMEEIHKLQMELFEMECEEVLSDHRTLTEFITNDTFMDEFVLEDPPTKKRKQKKPAAPKRKKIPTKAVKRELFNGEQFKSFSI